MIFSDALSRIGKSVNVIITDGHIFIAGAKYALDDLRVYSSWSDKRDHVEDYILPRLRIQEVYRQDVVIEGGFEFFIAAAWCNKGSRLGKSGNYREALDAYENAVEISPWFITARRNKDRMIWQRRA